MVQDTFKSILLLGRPAAGKSEVIDHLKKTPLIERKQRFHIGDFKEIDDFVYVWETFEIDDILTRHGKPRIWTDERYYFKEHFLWNLFIERINLTFSKETKTNPNFLKETTGIVEFARGGEKAFEEAFSYLSDEILANSGIVYIKVSYEESVRKNQRRARKGEEGSILHHSLPNDKMEFYYKTNDWAALEAKDPNYIKIRDFRLPYAVLANEPEVTNDPVKLDRALEDVFGQLWKKMSNV